MTLNLAQTSVAKSRPSVPYGANLFCFENSGLPGFSFSVKAVCSVCCQYKMRLHAGVCFSSQVLLAGVRSSSGRDLAPSAALPAGVDALAGVQTLVSSIQQVMIS